MADKKISSYFSSLPIKGYIISSNLELVRNISSIWEPEIFEWTNTDDSYSAIASLFSSPPNLILLDMSDLGQRALELLRMFKEETICRAVPIVLCLKDEDISKYTFDWYVVEADDLLLLPSSLEVMKTRLELTLSRASRSMDTNSLTYLPGNNSIVKFVESTINTHADFAFAYADLDNFKAFNDKYGFARGDEILMLTSRLISSTVHCDSNLLNFVGHVGGDDFVFCLHPDKVEDACKKIISTFDAVVPNFYDDDDRSTGMIISVDRQGNTCTFPLMGISLAVVFILDKNITHYGQLSERAAQVKKKAKQKTGSTYILDSRKYKPKPISCDC